MDNYNKLVNFYGEFGHSNVPYNWEEYKSLRRWAEEQRYMQNKLPQDQVDLLNVIDFRWREKQFPNVIGKKETDELKWTEKYNLLLNIMRNMEIVELKLLILISSYLIGWVYKNVFIKKAYYWSIERNY